MKNLFTLILMILSFMAYSQTTSVSIAFGISMKNNFNMGIDVKSSSSKWGGYFMGQGSGLPYTGETGVDYSDICDFTEITEYGVVEKSVWGMTFGTSYNLFYQPDKRSPFSIYGGIGFAEYIEVSETYYYYKWLDFPDLNEGNLWTYISSSRFLPSAEILLGIDFINKGPIRMGVIGGFNTASLLIGYAYLGIAIRSPDY